VLAYIDDRNWEDSCLGIIQWITKIWGGSQTVIIPTDGKTIAEEFWAILSAHDPDILVRYHTTGADLQRLNPEKFQSIVDADVGANLASSGMTEENLRSFFEENLQKMFLDPFKVTDELLQELIRRLAPLHLDPIHTQERKRQLVVKPITRGSSLPYPLTGVLDVIPYSDSFKTFAEINRDDQDNNPPELWLAAAIGANDQEHINALVARNVIPHYVKTSELSSSQLISIGIRPGPVLQKPMPLSLSMTALAFYRAVKAIGVSYQLPTVVVVGDTISDFCMHYALRRLRGRALWLPKWFFEDTGKYNSRLSSAINGAVELGELEHNQQLALISCSLSLDELHKIKDQIMPMMSRSSIVVELADANLVKAQLRYPSRCCTDGGIGEISTRMLVDNELPGVFDTPRPAKINPLDPQLHRWMVDVFLDEHRLPRHPALGSRVMLNNNSEVRTGLEATSYACPGFLVSGTDMDNNLIRPRIRVPDCEEIFRIILGDCGYEYKLSDKGAYAEQVIEKFGSLQEVGYSLRLDDRKLLRKYLDKNDPPKGSHSDGTYLNDNRRYLNFLAIAKILGSDDRAVTLIDSYVAKGILYRGFIFQCNRCADVAWFSISDIGQTFTCRRCGTTQPYLKKSWRHPAEPAWFCKLDEIVYLTMLHNGDIPLLTLDYLRRISDESFLYCPELEIRPTGSPKSYKEIDICCVSNGRLCIGEAKSNDSIASDKANDQVTAERYRDIAVKMAASMVVFATSQPAWNKATSDAISAAFVNHSYIEVRRITQNALFNI